MLESSPSSSSHEMLRSDIEAILSSFGRHLRQALQSGLAEGPQAAASDDDSCSAKSSAPASPVYLTRFFVHNSPMKAAFLCHFSSGGG